MNRTESLALWRRVAAGDLEHPQDDPVDLHAWIREVASKVLEADTVPDKVRPGTVLDAIGLGGKVDKNAELSRLLHLVDEFSHLEADGRERGAQRGERMAGLMRFARASDLVEHDVSDVELRKRIDRMFAR